MASPKFGEIKSFITEINFLLLALHTFKTLTEHVATSRREKDALSLANAATSIGHATLRLRAFRWWQETQGKLLQVKSQGSRPTLTSQASVRPLSLPINDINFTKTTLDFFFKCDFAIWSTFLVLLPLFIHLGSIPWLNRQGDRSKPGSPPLFPPGAHEIIQIIHRPLFKITVCL